MHHEYSGVAVHVWCCCACCLVSTLWCCCACIVLLYMLPGVYSVVLLCMLPGVYSVVLPSSLFKHENKELKVSKFSSSG